MIKIGIHGEGEKDKWTRHTVLFIMTEHLPFFALKDIVLLYCKLSFKNMGLLGIYIRQIHVLC